MYSLLIVDDEPLSQVGLKSMVDWAALDVEIIGSAPNGLVALEAIEKHHPDIVIADVRMPLLDGLGLIERCRGMGDAGPVFIVLTGYADFDALRRAMRGAALDFLVKLELDEATLLATIERAKAAVRERRRSGPSGGDGADLGDPFAETALTRLLAGGFALEEEARLALEGSGLPLGEAGFRVARFEVEYANAERLSTEERLRAYGCAIDMIKQIVGREASIMVAPLDVFSFAAILVDPAARAGGTLDKARDLTEKYFGVRLRIGLGLEKREALRAAESLREAAIAMESAARLAPGDRAIATFRERGPETTQATRDERRAALIEAVSARSAQRLRLVMDAALEELARPEIGLAESLALCCELLYPILERLDEADSLLDSLFPGEKEGWRCLFASASPAAAQTWLKIAGEGLAARFESASSRGRNPLVAGVQKYVRENISARLALGDVAAKFRVSPNHLSAVFKKYGGLGYSDFVAQVKVEKAKELIEGGHYKMFEVAQLLGFDDAFYFSKVFKKVAGLSPRDFYLRVGERGPSAEPPSEAES